MNFARFFTREEHIAGLEIDSRCLRLVLLKNDSGKTRVLFSVEEKLTSGVIENGVIKDEASFKKALISLKKKTRRTKRYVIVSLPAVGIYSHLYSFPQSVNKEKMAESMKLVVDFQLPMKPETIYWDWEQSLDQKQNMAFLAVAKRVVIDQYYRLLASAGWKIVATEFHPMSLARATKIFDADSGLLVDCRVDGITVTAIKNKIIRLVRYLPVKNISKLAETKKEIEGVLEYFKSEVGAPIKKIFFVGEKATASQLIEPSMMKDVFFDKTFSPQIWGVAVGAAERGLLPRIEDKLVSLLPVGTEKAYERQKAIAFADFVSVLSIAVSFLFVILFAGVWLLTIYLQQVNSNKLTALNAISLPVGTIEQEQRAVVFNDLVTQTGSLTRQIPRWSLVVSEIKKQLPSGVDLTGLNFGAVEGEITITGVAQNRTLLNNFKKNLQNSAMFSEVVMPLSNIGLRENIPFFVSFKLVDPFSIYFQ